MGVVDPATPIRWTLQCSSDGKYYERRHRLLPRQRTYPTRNETAPQKSEWTRLARKTQIQKRRLWKNKFEKRKPEPGKKFVKMAQEGGKQQNTAYGVFVQACWAQHKRQYPDELIHKEIEEFNKQCSVWWYNLSEQERDRFQEMADRSNAQQTVNQYTQGNNVTTVQGGQPMIVTQALRLQYPQLRQQLPQQHRLLHPGGPGGPGSERRC